MLEGEDDEEHTGEDEERDDRCAVPGVKDAAEGDGHDARDEGANLEEGAEVVDLTAAGEERGSRAGVARGEVEEVNGGEKASDA